MTVYRIWDTKEQKFLKSYNGLSIWTSKGHTTILLGHIQNRPEKYDPNRYVIKKYILTEFIEHGR